MSRLKHVVIFYNSLHMFWKYHLWYHTKIRMAVERRRLTEVKKVK